MIALRRIRSWSGDAQFTLVAALALIVGTLAPWLKFGSELGGSGYVSGMELNAGLLCLVIGAVVIWLLNRPAGARAAAESGAIASLALLAGALVLVVLIKHWNDPEPPAWGLIVSGLAALGMLAGSFVIQGETKQDLGPPD